MNDRRYPNALEQDGRNLSRLALDAKIPRPVFREQEISAVISALQRKRSVLLVGDVGVGKTSILHGVAAELPRIARDLWELATNAVLAGTRFLGDWQSKADSVLATLKEKRGVLYFTDVWNVLTIGTSSNDPSCLFDCLRPPMQTGELQLVGEVTPERFQALQKAPLLLTLFDVVPVAPLDDSKTAQIASDFATKHRIAVDALGIRELMRLCDRFSPTDRGPGRLLRLVQQIADYQREKAAIGENEPIDQAFIEKVFAIYSGLPRFVVSRTTTISAREIREWFRERIIGQERAIESVVEVITLYKAGLHDPSRPIGTLLFVGPTGVGKTELAKAIARYLFGSESRLLRFDLSEFKDYHAFQMLVGNPDQPSQPARLLEPVRAQPFQVILFDEIEKAHPNVWDMLLQLLDEGHVSPPSGARTNFRNTIIIATSNVGSQDAMKSPIGFVSARSEQIPIKSLEAVFRPELLNRFQHIVTFDGLTREHVRRIAHREIQQLLAREGIISRNLAVEVGDDVLDALVESGFDRDYGARALKRQVQQRVLFPIASRLMETDVVPGSVLKLDIPGRDLGKTGAAVTRVRVLDSDVSREQKREAARERAARAQRLSLAQLRDAMQQLSKRYSTLAVSCGKDQLVQRLSRLDEQRRTPQFWSNTEAANHILVEIDATKSVLTRLDSLVTHIDEIKAQLIDSPGTRELEYIGQSFTGLTERLGTAERELTRMGDNATADILVAITPLGSSPALRDMLFDTYRGWSVWRNHRLQVLMDPSTDTDAVFFAVRGDYAFGYLHREHGVHRLRNEDLHEAVRVTVGCWIHEQTEIQFGHQRALKQPGKFAERVRSQVEVLGSSSFALRNELTIAENRELAREIAKSWQHCLSSDAIVRRYDMKPFLLKDHLTGITSGRQSALKPAEFHELLCNRVDAGSDPRS